MFKNNTKYYFNFLDSRLPLILKSKQENYNKPRKIC